MNRRSLGFMRHSAPLIYISEPISAEQKEELASPGSRSRIVSPSDLEADPSLVGGIEICYSALAGPSGKRRRA